MEAIRGRVFQLRGTPGQD
ncbi:hypothetical protein TIFTF001_037861, partial [Ficus carica]